MGDESKISYIKKKLLLDPLAVDLQWSLLVAALSSYRHDTVLRPFPPMFINDAADFKDFSLMEKTTEKCPNVHKLKSLLQQCEENGSISKPLDRKLVELLQWTVQPKNFVLKTCDKEKYSVITELTGQLMPVTQPTQIFEVIYNSASEERFQEQRANRNIIYAYHGSRVENFHSILNHGLQGHMSKNALFGEGIYLSSELSVSMPYAPTGVGWTHSVLGDRLSCFAVCEIIDDEQSVKCSDKDPVPAANGEAKKNLSRSASRSRIRGAEGGEIPEKYYVVRNNDVIRVKYVLVYAEKSKSKHPVTTWRHWMKEHKFVLMVIFYGFILLAVGLYNSPSFHYYIKRYLRRR